MIQKKSASILRKFLVFNFVVFTILGLFTIVYLKAIQPNLVKKRTTNHYLIINNTVDHLQRLDINFNGTGLAIIKKTKDLLNKEKKIKNRLFSIKNIFKRIYSPKPKN